MTVVRPQFEVGQVLQEHWKSVVNSGLFNKHQIRMLNAIRTCRTSEQGWHLDQCDDCGHLQISYNSCRNRHCPKCQGKLREDWIRAQHERLLPVKYFHVVFTIPDTLNRLCLYQPGMIYSILFKAAWFTIKTFATDAKHLGAETGMTCILHTWGQTMTLHPHLHCIVPAGGMTSNGKWKNAQSKGKFLFPVKAMNLVFRAIFVRLLRKEVQKRRIVLAQSFFDELFKKRWVIYAKQPFLGPAQIIEYIGRYTHKIAISNHRIIAYDGHSVTFSYKDYRHNGKKCIMKLTALEFIRRFALHILPLRFVRIRHYGILNTQSKHTSSGVRAAIEKSGTIVSIIVNTTPLTAKQAFIHRCPVCKKGQMFIVGFGKGRSPPPDINALCKFVH